MAEALTGERSVWMVVTVTVKSVKCVGYRCERVKGMTVNEDGGEDGVGKRWCWKIGWFEPVSKNSHSVRAKIIAEHSLINVDNRISIGVKSLEFADTNFFFLSVGCCGNNAAPMPVFDASVII